ncbi:MAG: hypothetical protein IH614_19765 [Desulfuromonadales bacterium]|nr:hypothetical protein [Desulfuromonadales bacterium]
MTYKARSDVETVIALGKPPRVVDLFLTSYLTGLALAPVIAAEEEYASLQAQEDQDDVLDPETEEILSSPNAERDIRIAELATLYPHLTDAELERSTPPLDLTEWKRLKTLEVKMRFEDQLTSAVVNLSLGWPVDCRRSAKHDDIGNMERLLAKMLREGTEGTYLRGADNQFHPVTLAELRDVVIPEMVDYGFAAYQAKWQQEEVIQAAESAEKG